MPAYKTAIHDARRRAHEVLCGVLALDVDSIGVIEGIDALELHAIFTQETTQMLRNFRMPISLVQWILCCEERKFIGSLNEFFYAACRRTLAPAFWKVPYPVRRM